MRILIEGQRYPTDFLHQLLEHELFYIVKGTEGIITHVGYFHALHLDEVIYFLPKVFFWNNLALGQFDTMQIAQYRIEDNSELEKKYSWIKRLLILFYKSLTTYKRRCTDSLLIQKNDSIDLHSNIGEQEFTYLDLMLSFFNFYKKNHHLTAFQTVYRRNKQAKRPNWTKTIQKTQPLFNKKGQPIYTNIYNKKKIQNREEDLITIFLSILNHFQKTYKLKNIRIDENFHLYTENKFSWLQKYGQTLLSKIKYRYFSDQLKSMYRLCELYLSKTNKALSRKSKSEYIIVRNYNLIFEDMVDYLLTDSDLDENIQALKQNKDGKIIDHLFEYDSLIDNSAVHYIGDSKYYKPDNEVKGINLYKQFTYAKNVIQLHINLLNEKKLPRHLRYRDELTEGYNITPNFFIYGFIPVDNNRELIISFDSHHLESKGDIKKTSHFPTRLFDRDTLFVHQYQLNFLFILKAYTIKRQSIIRNFRTQSKKLFRENFIRYFKTQTEFSFYEKQFTKSDLSCFLNEHFRMLNGRCISIAQEENKVKLLVAVHQDATFLVDELDSFTQTQLT